MEELLVYVDGSSSDKKVFIGMIFLDKDYNVLEEYVDFLGEGTNNEAEYLALLKAIEKSKKFNPGKVIIFTDSELLIKQLSGEYRVLNPRLRELIKVILEEMKEIKVDVRKAKKEDFWIKKIHKLIKKRREIWV